MAVYNEIQVGRYNRLLQKLLSMKGSPPASSLAGEILTTLPLFHGVENRYLEGWDRFAIGNAVVTASVGNVSMIRLRNPSGSNMIAVLEKATALGTPITALFLALGALAIDLGGGSLTGTSAIDPRGRSGPALVGTFGNPLGIVTNPRYFIQPPDNVYGDFIQTIHQELPILPGQAVEILTNATNTTLRAGIAWRERFLEDSERT